MVTTPLINSSILFYQSKDQKRPVSSRKMSSPNTLSHPWEATTRSNTAADGLARAIVYYNMLVRDAKRSAEEYDRLHQELHRVYAMQRKNDSDKQSYIIQGFDMTVIRLLSEQFNKDREYRSKRMNVEREYWTETLRKARAVKEQVRAKEERYSQVLIFRTDFEVGEAGCCRGEGGRGGEGSKRELCLNGEKGRACTILVGSSNVTGL